MTHFTEALAHYNQLLSLGASQEQAIRDTMVAFELTPTDAEVLEAVHE
jgi:hypothetical protein